MVNNRWFNLLSIFCRTNESHSTVDTEWTGIDINDLTDLSIAVQHIDRSLEFVDHHIAVDILVERFQFFVFFFVVIVARIFQLQRIGGSEIEANPKMFKP